MDPEIRASIPKVAGSNPAVTTFFVPIIHDIEMIKNPNKLTPKSIVLNSEFPERNIQNIQGIYDDLMAKKIKRPSKPSLKDNHTLEDIDIYKQNFIDYQIKVDQYHLDKSVLDSEMDSVYEFAIEYLLNNCGLNDVPAKIRNNIWNKVECIGGNFITMYHTMQEYLSIFED